MYFIKHSFRHAETILNEPEFRDSYEKLISSIESITDEELIEEFNGGARKAKSLSEAINKLIKHRLENLGWAKESPIFQDPDYSDRRWRLDFAGHDMSIEVAFNHSGTIAWNLLKPVLASELNHVQKAVQTRIGIIICATAELKKAGGFDEAVGEFERFLTHLTPMRSVLTVPILIIGLKPPKSFSVKHSKVGGRLVGEICMHS
jgi:hypothetical protein